MDKEESSLVGKEERSEPSEGVLRIRAIFILLSEFCERLAYYSIDANLILLFTNTVGMGKANANTLALFWKGCVYIFPLLGGWLADSVWGRFKTIITGVVVYILSMVGLAIGVIPEIVSTQQWLVFVSLFIIAAASGAIKANVVTFGADQFSDLPKEQAAILKQTFFNWFYFSINFGAMIAFTGIAYVQQEISFTVGLAIPAALMFLSAVFFVVGAKWYIKLPFSGSVLAESMQIMYYSITYSGQIPSKILDDDEVKVEEFEKGVTTLNTTQRGSFLDKAKYVTDERGNALFEPIKVDNLKKFFKVIPILAFYVVFFLLYAQMGSVFFSQGTVMKLNLGDFLIPVSSLNVFGTTAILVLVPIFERGLYPLLRKHNINFGMLRRIGGGMLLVTLGVLYAGCLEIYRLQLFHEGKVIRQLVGTKEVLAVDLSVLWQAPGFFLIGAGEVLASITGLEFVYDQSPPTMKSMVIACYYLTLALGNYLGSALIAVTNSLTDPPWIGENLNKAHMDLYFFLLSIFGFSNFFAFGVVALKYKE